MPRYLAYLSEGQPEPGPPAVSLRDDAKRPGGPGGIIRVFRSRRLRNEYVAASAHETRYPGGIWHRAVSALSMEDALEFLGDCGQDDSGGAGCKERNCRRHLRPGQSITLGLVEPWKQRG